MDTDALSSSQKEALHQLQTLTNGGDADVAIGVLDSVNWDVQRAAEIIFDSGPSAPSTVSHATKAVPRKIEQFELDDSEQGLSNGRPGGREFEQVPSSSPSTLALLTRPLRLILTILTLPFHFLRALFRLLHIPLPQLPLALSSLSFYTRGASGSRPDTKADPRSAAERWVRALEEETGVLCISRARVRAGEGTSSGIGSSSSTLMARHAGQDTKDFGDLGKVLPDFFLGSYEEFAKTCAREHDPKIGCVILVSEEHDDVAEFKRSTLTDPALVKLIQDNDFLMWGGDIRDRDAWSAAQKLQATTYPFIAFIALQPRRGAALGSSSNTSSHVLTILSRHQGPSIPSTTAPTSAHVLHTHLTDQLLPRVAPFLTRVRTSAAEAEALRTLQAAERERERALRAEQDRAFEATKQRDRERIEARMAEERRAAEEARRRETEAAEAARKEKARGEWEARRMVWRRWGRRGLVPREPRPAVIEPARGRTMRIGVRMPDGRRGVRFFGEGDSLTAVYAYVDTLFIPEGKEFSSDRDPVSPPDGAEPGERGVIDVMEREGKSAEEWWGFKLVLSYPRREIGWGPAKRIGDIEGLRGGGQVVVEIIDDGLSAKAKGKSKTGNGETHKVEEGYDGYDTEESD